MEGIYQEYMDKRFEDMQKYMDKRFEAMQADIKELRVDVKALEKAVIEIRTVLVAHGKDLAKMEEFRAEVRKEMDADRKLYEARIQRIEDIVLVRAQSWGYAAFQGQPQAINTNVAVPQTM